MNRLTILLILLILGSPLISVAYAENYTPINVVGEVYLPFSFPADDGTNITGFSVELLEQISNLSGVKINNLKLMPWEQAYNLTLNNKDTIVLAIYKTPEREGSFLFIGPIAKDYSTIFLLEDSNISINSADDLKKMKIGAVSKDAGIDILKSIGVPDSQIITGSNLPAISSDLKNHTTDGFIYGEDAVIDFAYKTKSTFKIGIRLKEEPVYFGINKNSSIATASALEVALQQSMLSKNGTTSDYENLADMYRVHMVEINETTSSSITQTQVALESASVAPPTSSSAATTTKKSPGILPLTCIIGLSLIAIFFARNKP